LAARAAADTDLVVAEGAMGLFDGAGGVRSGSCAEVSRLLGWPVVLVVDASGSAQSLAAVAHGCATFPGAPRIAGVIANRVASPRHARMIEAGFARIDLPVLGLMPVDARLDLPSRHLGLVQAMETEAGRIEAIGDLVADHCDLAAIRASAMPTAAAPLAPSDIRPPGQRIAIARDAAFAFLYPHLLEGWREAGAEIRFFSPLADERPPDDCSACWLPGGYPELHAGRLATSHRFLGGLRRFAEFRPVHGECGGYMVLGRTLEDAEGRTHAMTGLLPVATSFAHRRLHLGYRRATWRVDTAFARAGETHLGHEFHYATIVAEEGEALAHMTDGANEPLPAAGHCRGNVSGTFFHLIA
jgi:cobyrinic acid a,c-diamide synthase